MATNPLYPGYSPEKPGEGSVNPLNPGYYPGKKIPRKYIPSSGLKFKVPEGPAGVDGVAAISDFLETPADPAEKIVR